MDSTLVGIVIIGFIIGYLINKYLDQRQQEVNHKINIEVNNMAPNAALEEMHQMLDSRINKAFENHSLLKQEWDSVKLGLGLKGKI